MITTKLPNNNKLNILKSVFGYTTFRPLQEDCIDSVLNKRDTLLVMPTGGGKSLCYQIPALMFKGLTLVVSPLISLMKDQVSTLKALGIEAELLNSSLSFEEYEVNKSLIRSRKTKLLFLAPETLFKEEILDLLDDCKLECIAIDEAHCISEWGHDFRPEYRKLKSLRTRYPNAVYLAVTATATELVRKDICTNLDFEDPAILVASFNRDNLFYEVIAKDRATEQTLDFLKKFKDQSGIIYCFSRKQVDSLTAELNAKGLKSLPYHAGLSSEERNRNQELFIRDDIPIMVATIAFGMGINKPNVRFVVHYDLPKNVESYYQETGRAGRDGLPSHCLLLYSQGDSAKIRYFIDQKSDRKQKEVAQRHLDAILEFAQSRQCRRIPLINYFGEKYTIPKCELCDNCVNPAVPTVDLTKEAVMFFNCISELNTGFGAGHIIDVLRGSKSDRVEEYYHNECRIYGKGKHLSQKQWAHVAQQFVIQKVVDKEPRYGVLTLNHRSFDIMAGRYGFDGVAPPMEKTTSKARINAASDYDGKLFDRLRAKRKELADRRGVPPYVIFSDRSLMDMCVRLPKNKKEFANVFGVGQEKLEKFSDVFMRVING